MKYKDSGVDIDRANRAKKSIARHVRSTWSKHVLSDVGAFGGLFAIPQGYEAPVLVSSIDGVGTKLLVAVMTGRYDTVGQDLVNHCVNDILVQGARPLFFLDYIASGQVDPDRVGHIVGGLSTACRENGCALIGGETAEMPGIYQGDDFDLAGCIVGVVDRKRVIDGSAIEPGDCVFGLPSSGLHTNGYSLARKIIFDKLDLGVDAVVDELGCAVGEELLKVHRSYLDVVTAIMDVAGVKGLAHITGGGIVENLPRVLPDSCNAVIYKNRWDVPAVFQFLRKRGEVDEAEMYRVFNMGLGMLVVTAPADREAVLACKAAAGIRLVGEITRGSGEVVLA